MFVLSGTPQPCVSNADAAALSTASGYVYCCRGDIFEPPVFFEDEVSRATTQLRLSWHLMGTLHSTGCIIYWDLVRKIVTCHCYQTLRWVTSSDCTRPNDAWSLTPHVYLLRGHSWANKQVFRGKCVKSDCRAETADCSLHCRLPIEKSTYLSHKWFQNNENSIVIEQGC